MKKIFAFLTLTFFPFALFCAPFGLKIGMTLEEVAEQCKAPPELVEDDLYLITPKKKHSFFDYYLTDINDEKGLCGTYNGIYSGSGIILLIYIFQNYDEIQDSEDKLF